MKISAQKENYLNILTCKKGRDVPFYAPPFRAPVGLFDWFEKGPEGGGKDGFGVIWNATPAGAMPSNKEFILDDIKNWESRVRFPDLDAIDWEVKSEIDLALWDRSEQVIEYGMSNSHFERLMALMGFENGLCALITDPENVKHYMQAYTEYRIKLVKKVSEYYHPDTICSYDDIATGMGPFVSREIYQELISPGHKAFNDAVKAEGIIPVQHCCGRIDWLIEDFIAEGAQMWASAQPENDIAAILQKYGSKISVAGGFDTNKVFANPQFTREDVIQEVKDTIDRYAGFGSFIAGNVTLFGNKNITQPQIIELAAAVVLEYGKNYYKDN